MGDPDVRGVGRTAARHDPGHDERVEVRHRQQQNRNGRDAGQMGKGDVPEATQMVMDLRENYGIFCSIVVYPVIPKGDIIFRLIPTASHSFEEVDITLNAFAESKKKTSSKRKKFSPCTINIYLLRLIKLN